MSFWCLLSGISYAYIIFLVKHKWIHTIQTIFLTSPSCPHSHSWSRNISGNPRSRCRGMTTVRGKRSVMWRLGWKDAILYSFIGFSELRNLKCHVGKEIRDRSLGLCLELGLKPGHPAAFLTRLLTRISASTLLKELKFHYCSFI